MLAVSRTYFFAQWVLGSRQQHGRALSDHQRVLVVRRRAMICRYYRPAVGGDERAAGTRGNDRLDGNHQALRENLIVASVGIIRYARRFMNRAANAVACQLADHRESAT